MSSRVSEASEADGMGWKSSGVSMAAEPMDQLPANPSSVEFERPGTRQRRIRRRWLRALRTADTIPIAASAFDFDRWLSAEPQKIYDRLAAPGIEARSLEWGMGA